MAVYNGKIRLQFNHVGGGLMMFDGKPLSEFAIAGADQTFLSAAARIDGDTIVVSHERIARPVAVRYACDVALPNLMNKEGLPASPFRTDSWTRSANGT